MRRECNAVFDSCVRANLAKAPFGGERFNVLEKAGSDSLPSEFRSHPNSFEERNGPRRAAIGVFANRELGKSDGRTIFSLCDKTPCIVSPDESIDILGVS